MAAGTAPAKAEIQLPPYDCGISRHYGIGTHRPCGAYCAGRRLRCDACCRLSGFAGMDDRRVQDRAAAGTFRHTVS